MRKRLPRDLSALDPMELERARVERDALLEPLFQRWPALTKLELSELRRLYDERVQIAKHLGRTTRRAGEALHEQREER